MVDCGNGIVGDESASKKYFNENASDLSVVQAALLAAILPSPHRRSPVNPNEEALARQNEFK